MDVDTTRPQHRYRVIGRLPGDLVAQVTAEVRRFGGDGTEVRLGDGKDRIEALLAEQQIDIDDAFEGPFLSLAPVSGAQARGAIVGGLAFGTVGAVLGALVGLLPMFALGIAERMGLWVLVGVFAGAVTGFVFGGGREPELEGKTRDASDDVTVAITTEDAAVHEQARGALNDARLELARRTRDAAHRSR